MKNIHELFLVALLVTAMASMGQATTCTGTALHPPHDCFLDFPVDESGCYSHYVAFDADGEQCAWWGINYLNLHIFGICLTGDVCTLPTTTTSTTTTTTTSGGTTTTIDTGLCHKNMTSSCFSIGSELVITDMDNCHANPVYHCYDCVYDINCCNNAYATADAPYYQNCFWNGENCIYSGSYCNTVVDDGINRCGNAFHNDSGDYQNCVWDENTTSCKYIGYYCNIASTTTTTTTSTTSTSTTSTTISDCVGDFYTGACENKTEETDCNATYVYFVNGFTQCGWEAGPDQCHSNYGSVCHSVSLPIDSGCAGLFDPGDCSEYDGQESNCSLYYVGYGYGFENCKYNSIYDICIVGNFCNISMDQLINLVSSTTSSTITTSTTTNTGETTTTTGETTTTGGTTTTEEGTTTTTWNGNYTTDYNPTHAQLDCSNVTKMMEDGKLLPASLCPLTMGIGLEWIAGGFILITTLFLFFFTRNFIPASMGGLLVFNVLLDFFPPVFRTLTPVILAFVFCAVFVYLRWGPKEDRT